MNTTYLFLTLKFSSSISCDNSAEDYPTFPSKYYQQIISLSYGTFGIPDKKGHNLWMGEGNLNEGLFCMLQTYIGKFFWSGAIFETFTFGGNTS